MASEAGSPKAEPAEPGLRVILPPSSLILGSLRGLVQAREKGWLLAWDTLNWLYLFDQVGKRQGQVHLPVSLTVAACAEDGSAYAAGSQAEVSWLGPDLMTTWQCPLTRPALAVALDAFGQFLAVADAGGQLHVFDRVGRLAWQVQSPRPFHHLAFVPAVPYLVACADYGLVACFDQRGQWAWREGLVAHVGALTVDGYGEQIILACFSEGLLRYALDGTKHPRQMVAEPCRLASISFDGQRTLAAGVSRRLYLLDAAGQSVLARELEHTPVAIALNAYGDAVTAAFRDGTVLALDL
jgi:hypothetical protein